MTNFCQEKSYTADPEDGQRKAKKLGIRKHSGDTQNKGAVSELPSVIPAVGHRHNRQKPIRKKSDKNLKA